MAYDDSSFYGDLICDEYDEENNFMNPPSSTGDYVYHIIGYGLDLMNEMCSQFMNDFNILTANTKGLDNFWGLSYNMKRPEIDGRLMTDDEYKIYLYLRNCRLMTREDIEICFNNCFSTDDYGVYFDYEDIYMEGVDHIHYQSVTDDSSNLKKRSDDTSKDYVINFENEEEDVKLVKGYLSKNEDTNLIIYIPFGNWDEAFLTYLEPYISIKGNIKIKEYNPQ